MSSITKIVAVILLVVMFLGMWLVGNYNSLVSSKAEVDNSWARVESQYQLRFDLVDNLVQTVKGGQKQEVDVFGKIADARKQYNASATTEDKAQALTAMETNIALIPRLQEAYPELKSNQQVQVLMDKLSKTEDDIRTVRDSYSKAATNYNVNVGRFPKNIFAKTFGFSKMPLFKSDAGAASAPKVKFN